MTDREPYAPGPASGAQMRKNEGSKWTLILTRDLRHAPEKVWQALTDPAELREWAPYDVDRSLANVGTVDFKWLGSPVSQQAKVTRAEAPRVLECDDMRWELEASDNGTRLTLWHNIDRRYIAMGAAGWHICFDVLDHLLSGAPIARIAGPAAMGNPGWQRLHAEYSKLFGVEPPSWTSKAAQKQ